MSELHDLTALEQASAIREGSLSPVQLTEHYLSRIEQLNDTLGAFVTPTPELARAQAVEAEKGLQAAHREDRPLPPLYGVPVPVKDTLAVAGVRTTRGSAVFADSVPDADDPLVGHLRNAGTIMLGKTNTPEFALPPYTENKVAPPARTPWDLALSAGGSSGGAAAAVAAGLAPLAQGTDDGGSIRIPASVCGLVGIKPSRGRVAAGPLRYDAAGLSVSGPLARTVADAAALLDVMTGAASDNPYTAPPLPKGTTFLSYAGKDPGPLRIVALVNPPIPGVHVHPDCLAAHHEAITVLRELGHHVDELDVPADESGRRAFQTLWAVLAVAHPVDERAEADLMPLTRHLRKVAGGISAPEYAEALQVLRAMGQLVSGALLQSYDVMLSPTLAQPPVPVGGLRDDDPQAELENLTRFTPYTPLYNLTGQPAMNVPLHWRQDGLPIGVMLGADLGDEGTLISLAAQLESARPWFAHHPAMW
ncbi:amidase [Streptomyces sp. NPDC086777]|uniref:amidase n=1 Tax=Streptomyces sp. NPDC086777 TaxID=3154866 RepID=UPI00344DB547